MRCFIPIVLAGFLAAPALASEKNTDGSKVISEDRRLAVELQADRIRAYNQAMGLDMNTPREDRAAPDGLMEMLLYVETAIVPETDLAVRQHRVVKGDTLYNLSKRYFVDVEALKSANNLEGTHIRVGQSLIIPMNVVASSEASEDVQPATTSRNPNVYAVTKSDTLYGIARQTCVEVKDIITLNPLANPDQIAPGTVLKLPENHCLTG